MPRTARIKAPGQVYSVVTRVNNSEFAFSDFSLCEAFLAHLKQMKTKHGFKLYGFVLMSSHVHLLIEPDDEKSTISDVMCAINGKFAQKHNCFNKRKGHFWMQRFASKIVERGRYLANSLIYFALNPVRAGICANPLEFKYSSIQNVVQGLYADILDALPEGIKEVLERFLNVNNYVELLEKCTRLLKKFSFDLKKNNLEQRFRYFCGSSGFINQNKSKYQVSVRP